LARVGYFIKMFFLVDNELSEGLSGLDYLLWGRGTGVLFFLFSAVLSTPVGETTVTHLQPINQSSDFVQTYLLSASPRNM
jgi:hypothetical protein